MHECERIIQSIEHFYGHLHIESSGHLGLTSIEYKEDLTQNIQNIGTVKLETERLILRRHTLDDASAMYKNWASEKEVTKFLSWEPYESIEDVEKILSEWIPQYINTDFYFWTIELKDSGELVGDISVITIDPDTYSVELGYGIGSKWWGKGIVAEAGKALIRFFFEEIEVKQTL